MIVKMVFSRKLPSSYNEFGRLAFHLRYVERSTHKLVHNTFYTR